MLRNARLPLVALAPIALAAFSVPSHAFFGPFKNMFNGNDNDGYYDDYGPGYGGGPYGYGGGPYGGGPYGGGYGGSPYGGYGASPYGYGAPGYYGGAPYAAPVPAAPQSTAPASSGASSGEIDALKRRIEELESQQRHQSPPSNDWPSAPAFRPMGQGY